MTDRKELQERVESLEKRVSELESLVDENHTPTTKNGIDRFDAAVIEYVEEHGAVGPRECVALYKKLTAISKEDTAQRRAKQLRQTAAYEQAVQK